MKLYDYKNNVKLIKTVGGEWVITLTDEVMTELQNYIFDASELAEKEGRKSTAVSIMTLYLAIREKVKEAEGGDNER